jgi:acyl transferase domain-containing protein
VGTVKRASINSTGYGGTTCHAVIEAAPVAPSTAVVSRIRQRLSHDLSQDRTYVFPLSHHRNGGLAKWARRLKRHLIAPVQNSEISDLERLAFTLSCRRSHLLYRATVEASSKKELCQRLDSVIDGSIRETKSAGRQSVCLVFTGMIRFR